MMHYSPVLTQGVCGHQDVVQVDYHMSLINQLLQDVFMKVKESDREVGQAKEHDGWFVQPFVCHKGCLLLITLCIHLGEVSGLL